MTTTEALLGVNQYIVLNNKFTESLIHQFFKYSIEYRQKRNRPVIACAGLIIIFINWHNLRKF